MDVVSEPLDHAEGRIQQPSSMQETPILTKRVEDSSSVVMASIRVHLTFRGRIADVVGSWYSLDYSNILADRRIG
jgi:hypothetical protein